MVKVTACIFAKEEGLDEFLAIAKELVEKTNALDPGCIKYELCKVIGDPLRYVMLEEWEDQKSLDDHLKSSHFLELIPKLDKQTSKPAELTLLEKMF
jgi:quinol monooxygenase YgiN